MKKHKDHKMTLEEHLQTASELAIATHYLDKIFWRCLKHYPKSGKLMKSLRKLLNVAGDGILSHVKNHLDNEYHKLIDEETFRKHGHIYYNLEDRYLNEKAKSPGQNR
jgi:hypothetical protein